MIVYRLILTVVCVVLMAPVIAKSQPTDTSTSMFDRPADSMEQAIIDHIKDTNLNWQFGISFLVLNPQDSLRRAIEKLDAPGTGYGFNLNLAYYMDPIPFVMGFDAGVAFFGSTSQTFYEPLGPFTDTLRYESLNTHIPINLFVRFQPNICTWVFPYAEVVGGLTVVGSSLDISRNSVVGQTSDSKSESSATWQYGIGAGIMIKLVDFVTLPSELQRVLLDVRGRYLWGSDVSVATIKVADNKSYTVATQYVPDTRNVHVSVGIAVQF